MPSGKEKDWACSIAPRVQMGQSNSLLQW